MYCWCGWLSSFRDKNFNRGFPDQKLNLLVSFYSWAGSHRWDMLRSKKMTGRRPTSLGHSDHSNNHYKASLKRGTWTTLPRKKSILDDQIRILYFLSSIEFQMKKHANVLHSGRSLIWVLCHRHNSLWSRKPLGSRVSPGPTGGNLPRNACGRSLGPWGSKWELRQCPRSSRNSWWMLYAQVEQPTKNGSDSDISMTIYDHWSQDLSPKQYRNPCAK